MNSKTTMPAIYHGLMRGKTILKADHPYCCVCGRSGHVVPLNDHHVVWRSWGELFPDTPGTPKPLRKPTLPLCGNGNTHGCHKLAHDRKLHFNYTDDEGWTYLLTETTDYAKALDEDGWRFTK